MSKYHFSGLNDCALTFSADVNFKIKVMQTLDHCLQKSFKEMTWIKRMTVKFALYVDTRVKYYNSNVKKVLQVVFITRHTPLQICSFFCDQLYLKRELIAACRLL